VRPSLRLAKPSEALSSAGSTEKLTQSRARRARMLSVDDNVPFCRQ
jgi:hypothetical protein